MVAAIRTLFRGLLMLFGMAGFWTAVYMYLNRQATDDTRVVVQGAGNSGNTINVDTVVDALAAQLAQHIDFAEVDSDELSEIGEAVRKRALDGDPTAALVMLRVAQLQSAEKDKTVV